jgi:hypothetical protein
VKINSVRDLVPKKDKDLETDFERFKCPAGHRDRRKLVLRRCCLHFYTNVLARPSFTRPSSQARIEGR